MVDWEMGIDKNPPLSPRKRRQQRHLAVGLQGRIFVYYFSVDGNGKSDLSQCRMLLVQSFQQLLRVGDAGDTQPGTAGFLRHNAEGEELYGWLGCHGFYNESCFYFKKSHLFSWMFSGDI